jgi:predicted lipoprotein
VSFRRFACPLLACLAACSAPAAKPDAVADGFDRHAMLDHLAHNVLLPMQADFDAKAQLVAPAIDAYCNALDAGAVGTTRDDAVAAWARAIDSWQSADAVLIGPAAMTEKDLRYKIYAWPLLAPCGLDRDTAARWTNAASYDVAVQPPNERSLLAIEYLLFTTATTHTCPTEPVGWSALGADLPRARCRLAHAIALDVAAQATALHTAWREDGGDYAGELANAGASGDSIASAQEGVNRMSDGMFYVDRIVKDMKLGEAAGITTNVCNTVQEPCLAEVELRFADRGVQAIRANLAALREVFTGETATVDGPSFDDFLRARDHADVADRMIANLDAAIAKANALPDSYVGALQSSYPSVVATHAAVNLFTDDLKSQFLTVLALDIPDDVAADND